MAVQLLGGFITLAPSSGATGWAMNDFESMPQGPCTTLTGQTTQGPTTFGSAFFTQR